VAGPLPLIVIATIKGDQHQADADHPEKKNPPGKSGILIVVGNSRFAANSYFAQYANGDLFLNSINFLADEAGLITYDHPNESKPLLLTSGQFTAISLTFLAFVPLAVLVCGLVVYRIRRSQR